MRIVCAALRLNGILVVGPRHYDQVMRQQIARLPGEWTKAEQGFIDQRGTFYDREAAWRIAQGTAQIVRRVGGDEHRLFSENLY